MPNLYISEYAELPQDMYGRPLPIRGKRIATKKVAFTGTSAASAALNDATRFVVLSADADCHIAFGPGSGTPTATTSDEPLWAKTYAEFSVERGSKIAAIAAA